MESRHFLLTAASYTPGVERWVSSSSVMTERFQPVIAMYQNHFPAEPHCRLLKIDQPWPGNAKRFVNMTEVIKHLGTDRWYLWTDCADVVFQRAPILFDALGPNIRGIACSEGMTHDENAFWHPFLKNTRFESIRHLDVHNAGTFAMRGDFFLEFTQFLTSVLTALKQFPNVIDQLLFNYWIQQNREHFITNNSLCLNLYNRFIPESDPANLKEGFGTLVNGRFVDRHGAEFPIVHANGDLKHILEEWKPNR